MGRDADFAQPRDGLRCPGRTGLAIAGERFDAENPTHVSRSAALAPGKLGHPIEQSALGEILGGRRMHGMKIGVVTYVVLLQFGNHVAPSALLEDARLFPDQFECGADAAFGEHLGQALCCVVVRRQQVILRIEPEDDVDVGLAGGGDGLSGNQSEEQQEGDYPSGRGFHGRDVYRETAEQTRVQPGRQRINRKSRTGWRKKKGLGRACLPTHGLGSQTCSSVAGCLPSAFAEV